ncbi:MAG TPA: mannonate dehydratase [Flavitalea sp.]|nr:mannonate dehydratase [Flavitalea sp.]
MSDNRRDFIKKGASLAAAAGLGTLPVMAGNAETEKIKKEARKLKEVVKDAGMHMSEAFFFSGQTQKIALCRQMAVSGAVAPADSKLVGENAKPWDPETIKANKAMWEKEGMQWNVVEGPPSLGTKTKLGLDGKDEEISNFITFMKNLKKYGNIDVICYNWMPVISWYRTSKDKPGRGGALVTAFDYEEIKNAPLTEYGEVSKETLWKNLEYFLKAAVPEAEKIGMKLAMHPDDPQVDSIKGISRIMTTVENFNRMTNIVKSPYNGITMCQGNFALMGADIPATIRDFGKRGLIHFVHFRNVKGGKFKFEEAFHDEGIIDMHAAMQAYYDIGFKGAIRPDHVPTMAGDSNEHAGYSTIGTLFALGYMRGLMESISKTSGNK